MADATKPYTLSDCPSLPEMVDLDRVRATVEALAKAEAERDEARAELASISQEFGLPPTIRPVEGEIRRMLDGWRDARAEVARLQDLHTRCAAFDDQPGPSCVVFAAQVARLRELVALLLPKADAFWRSGETRPPWVAEARAALKDTP